MHNDVRIDAHVHLWDLTRRDVSWIDEARRAIRRNFLVADWIEVADSARIDSAVLVQALNDLDETVDLLAYAAATWRVVGVVGWLDLAAPDVAARLAALRAGPNGAFLLGIRHLALVDDDPGEWLCSPPVQRGLAAVAQAGLPYDLIFRPEHLDAVLRTVRDHPGLTFVLDHLGKPPIASGLVDEWAASIRLLAAEPNVICKLSGMLTIARPDWTVADLGPYADGALEAFGADRVLFGSDWPVSLLAAPYADVVAVVEQLLRACSERERAQVFGGTAARVYAGASR